MKRNKILPLFLALVLLSEAFLCVTLTGCQNMDSIQLPWTNTEEPLSDTKLALNTYVTITLYDQKDQSLIDHCFDLIDQYEKTFSRTLDYSEISRINQSPDTSISLSEDTGKILKTALEYAKRTDGAFDPTIGTVSSLWDFSSVSESQTPVVPSDAQITQALCHVDYKNISIEKDLLTKKDKETVLDLGAIAKGYIADRLKEYLTSQGVTSGIINLGGNVLCIGTKPDGTPFQIGIQKPFEEYSDTIGSISVSDYSVVSSGIYERCFRKDNRFYHHILDPSTGYPVENNLIAVTVLSPASVDGDALSTSCMVLGLEEGMRLIESMEDTYAVFVTDDYELHFTEGFEEKGAFQPTSSLSQKFDTHQPAASSCRSLYSGSSSIS